MADQKKQQQPLDPYASLPDTLAQQDDPYASMPDSFAATPDNKEGVYRMHTPDGTETKVPYSKVMDAYKAGYKIHPDDRLTYANDKVAELKGKGQQGKFNPDTDLPGAYQSVSASPKFGTAAWFKEKAHGVVRGTLDALPTAGGMAGGLLAGGAGAEAGPGDIAIAAAGSAAGGGLGEAIRQEAKEKLYPYEHRLTPKEAAVEIAAQAGSQALSEATGRVLGKAVNPAIKYLGKTADESAKAGVDLLPSEAHGKAPSYVEKFVKGSVLTSGKMDKFRELQNEQTKAAVDKLADSISNFKGSPEQLGNLVQSGIDNHVQQFRQIQNQMYGDIEKQVNERTIKVPVTKQVASSVLDHTGKPIMRTVTTLQDQLVDDVMPSTAALKTFAKDELKKLDQVEKILDPNLLGQSRSMLQNILDAPPNLTFKAMRAARSDTLAKVRELDQALAGKQAGLAKKMAGIFDDSIMDAVQKSKIPGLEAQVRAADAFTANEHRMFEQALVKKVVDTKRPEAIATLIRNKNMGLEETRDLFKVLPPALHKPVQRQIIVDTMRQSMNNVSKTFNERKFAATLGAIGDERGQVIFGPNWKNVKELTSIMERINGPVGMQGGSGASLQNFSILKNAMLLAIPGGEAASGHWGGAVGSLAAEWVSLNVLATAMTNPATATKMLKVAREIIAKTPYAVTGAVNELGGKKSLSKLKELKDQAEKQKPPTPTTPGPQSSVTVTHRFNPQSGQIEAA